MNDLVMVAWRPHNLENGEGLFVCSAGDGKPSNITPSRSGEPPQSFSATSPPLGSAISASDGCTVLARARLFCAGGSAHQDTILNLYL